MGLEAGTIVANLVETNPLATDPRSEGDDHLRLIKTVVKTDVFSRDAVHTAVDKVTQVDADEFVMMDSVVSFVPKRTTWASIKATSMAFIIRLAVLSVHRRAGH